jgi:hypothetical protein
MTLTDEERAALDAMTTKAASEWFDRQRQKRRKPLMVAAFRIYFDGATEENIAALVAECAAAEGRKEEENAFSVGYFIDRKARGVPAEGIAQQVEQKIPLPGGMPKTKAALENYLVHCVKGAKHGPPTSPEKLANWLKNNVPTGSKPGGVPRGGAKKCPAPQRARPQTERERLAELLASVRSEEPVEISHADNVGCVNKRAYPDRKRAEAVMAQHRGADELHAYKCPRCSLWHVGHIARRTDPFRLAKLLENPNPAPFPEPIRETPLQKAVNAQRAARPSQAISIDTGNVERRLKEQRWRERSRDRYQKSEGGE